MQKTMPFLLISLYMTVIVCKNCEHHFKGNYCPHCGQTSATERIGAKYFLHDIPHSIFHIDKGFWYSFKSLFTHPGVTLKNYLDGKRAKHFKPFAYLFIISTITIIVTAIFNKIILR
jgi:hypothetical protein